MQRYFWFPLFSLGLILASDSRAWPQSYSFESLDFPGALYTVAEGINDRGDLVGGYAEGPFGSTHGFLYSRTEFAVIDVSEASDTLALGINNRGQVVGTAVSTEQEGFLYIQKHKSEVVMPLKVPFETGVFLTRSNGINNKGQIVGEYLDNPSSNQQHGFLYDDGVFTSIDVPGATVTSATGINDHGNIVGFYEDSSGLHGFVEDGENFDSVDVSFSGGFDTVVLGINGRGDLAGIYEDGSGSHGFIRLGDVFMPINVPGASRTVVLGINRNREIVGFFLDDSGTHGFTGTPVKSGKPRPAAPDTKAPPENS